MMKDQKKLTMDWLQFVEQVRDRISMGKDKEFSYEFSTYTSCGKRITFLINVKAEPPSDGEAVVLKFKGKDIA